MRCHRRDRRRRGFTLIELLVVVAIIGILAAAAIPTFGRIKQRSFDSQIRADARSVADAQELYYNDQGTYASDVGDLAFTPSPGSVISVGAGNSGSLVTSFRVTISHPGTTYSTGCEWVSDGTPNLSCS
jgi:prepilin-type N-terminal cleavage/methylation domain-containing protein